MPKNTTTQAAITWLETGEAPNERSPEVVAGLILLAHDLPLEVRLEALPNANFSPDVEMALLVLAQRADAVDLMIHLRDHATHKTTAKQAKKFLFRAKQRGADVPLEDAPTRAVCLTQRPDPLPSYCSTFDREGGQVVVLGGWDEEHGAWALVGIVQGDHGLNTVAWLPKMSRSRLKTVLVTLAGERSEELVEVSSTFAAGWLKWALCHAESASRRIEGDRSRVRRVLQDVEPLADFCLVQSEPDAGALASSATLLDDSCFEAWLLCLPQLLEDAAPTMAAAASAGGVVTSDAALLDALIAHAERWFDDERRLALARRLEITAMLLANLRRNLGSSAALAVARALRPGGEAIAGIPLIRAALASAAPLDAWRATVEPAVVAEP